MLLARDCLGSLLFVKCRADEERPAFGCAVTTRRAAAPARPLCLRAPWRRRMSSNPSNADLHPTARAQCSQRTEASGYRTPLVGKSISRDLAVWLDEVQVGTSQMNCAPGRLAMAPGPMCRLWRSATARHQGDALAILPDALARSVANREGTRGLPRRVPAQEGLKATILVSGRLK
jgi:hypothetical protein